MKVSYSNFSAILGLRMQGSVFPDKFRPINYPFFQTIRNKFDHSVTIIRHYTGWVPDFSIAPKGVEQGLEQDPGCIDPSAAFSPFPDLPRCKGPFPGIPALQPAILAAPAPIRTADPAADSKHCRPHLSLSCRTVGLSWSIHDLLCVTDPLFPTAW